MSNPTANPLGAGGDVTKAAAKMSELGLVKPFGQSPNPDAPVEANPEGQKPRDEKGRFAKAEPETADPNDIIQAETEEEAPNAEEVDVSDDAEATEAEGDSAEQSEPETSEDAELADTLEGLAEQLGIDPDELTGHLKATVKIDGEEQQVNLSDLQSGYQMQSDYQRKTAELADQRRAFEAEQQAIEQQRTHFQQQLAPLVEQLEGQVQGDHQVLQQLLDAGDWTGYESYKIQVEQRRMQLDAAKHEQQRLEAQKADDAKRQYQTDIAENNRILMSKNPEWAKNPELGRKAVREIKQYLKAEGVPAEVADGLYDAHSILITQKAMRWDALQKEKPAQLKKAKNVPKFSKPGASKPAEDPKVKVRRNNLNRLRKSGKVEDAARLMKDFI